MQISNSESFNDLQRLNKKPNNDRDATDQVTNETEEILADLIVTEFQTSGEVQCIEILAGSNVF